MNIRILYIEADPFAVEHAQKYFSLNAKDLRIEAAPSASAGRKLLKQKEYDVLLVDFTLPDGNALDIIRDVHSAGLILPIAVVTGNDQEELLVKVLRAGASDYVVKKGDYVTKLPGILRNLASQYTFRKKIFSRLPSHDFNIIYADTNEQDVTAALEYFHRNMPRFHLKPVRYSDQVLQMLSAQNNHVALVITETSFPNMSAMELIRSCRHTGINVPFIILTSVADESAAVAALKLGAFDYIVKRERYLAELANSSENAIYRSQLDELSLKLYSEIEQINASLEEKVLQRTAELQNEVELRSESERQLKDAVRQKDILLMEIHHRVKNNLQVISSLLNLQADGITDKRVLSLFEDCRHRVNSMALIHEKMYQSKNLVNIDIRNYMDDLIRSLIDAYDSNKTIHLHTDIEDHPFRIDTIVPLGLILNEIISNSLKYAFGEKAEGDLYVSLHGTAPHKFLLEVSDNGKGIPETINFDKAESLGMQLIQMLSGQINGNVRVTREGGTKYTIEFEEEVKDRF